MSEDTTNILIFGDSNTWGYNCQNTGRFPYLQRWTTILQSSLGDKFNVIPEGLNGRTCIQESPCLFEEGEYDFNGRKHLPAIVHSHKPLDIIVVALGTNDTKCKFQNSARDIMLSVKTLVRDLQKMTNIGRADIIDFRPTNLRPPKIVVMSLPTINFISPFSELYDLPLNVNELAREANRLLELECGHLGVTFVSTESVGISLVDGLHFDAEHMTPLASLMESTVHKVLEN
jgi:lysophospholipase L1-like esterase